MFSKAGRLIDFVSDACGRIISGMCLVLFVFVTLNALLRYLFRKPIWGSEEINGFLLGSIIFIGLACVLKEKGHIRVEVLANRLPDRICRGLEYLNAVIVLIWSICLVTGIIAYGQYIIKIGMQTATLRIPLSWVYWVPIAGASLFFLQAIVEAARTFAAKGRVNKGADNEC